MDFSFINTETLLLITISVLFLLNLIFPLKKIRFLLTPRHKRENLKQVLQLKIPFFRKLSPKQQEEFKIRTLAIHRKKKFVGRGLKISEEMTWEIAALQAQITFGYSNFLLSQFHTFILYPSSFISPHSGNPHKGEVSSKGVISLSWDAFQSGNLDHSDGINLGLHEMAHALMHTIIHTNDHDQNLDQYLFKVVQLGKAELNSILQDPNHFFRDYAGKNIFEFFAVAIEKYFEQPAEFKQAFPLLFDYMWDLLNFNSLTMENYTKK